MMPNRRKREEMSVIGGVLTVLAVGLLMFTGWALGTVVKELLTP